MNFKERVNSVLHHEKPDRIPFMIYDIICPQGELERELRNNGMGLCVWNAPAIWPEMPNVSVEIKPHGNVETRIFKTPIGNVSEKWKTRVGRVGNHSTRSIQTDWMIKDVSDYDVVIFMIEDTVYHGNDTSYHDKVRDLGGDGIIRGEVLAGFRAPYDTARKYLGTVNWAIEQKRRPDEFANLMRAEERRIERLFPFIANSPAELISVGNLRSMGYYMSPGQSEKYILPFYQKYMPLLHSKGKIGIAHADQPTLKCVKDLIPRTGVDVIDGFTPPPVGDLTLAEAKASWGDKIVIWVNFPESIFWEGVEKTKKFAVDLLRSAAPGEGLIVGMTEMGLQGIVDERTELAFKAGFRCLADVMEKYGEYPLQIP